MSLRKKKAAMIKLNKTNIKVSEYVGVSLLDLFHTFINRFKKIM